MQKFYVKWKKKLFYKIILALKIKCQIKKKSTFFFLSLFFVILKLQKVFCLYKKWNKMSVKDYLIIIGLNNFNFEGVACFKRFLLSLMKKVIKLVYFTKIYKKKNKNDNKKKTLAKMIQNEKIIY